MTQTVHVTQADIDAGKASCLPDDGLRCSTCPVARGATRAFGRPARTGGAYISFADDPGGELWVLPEHATEWIRRCDRGEPVSPFSFVVERVEEQQP